MLFVRGPFRYVLLYGALHKGQTIEGLILVRNLSSITATKPFMMQLPQRLGPTGTDDI